MAQVHPLVDRYWQLAGELTTPPSGPPEPTMGAAHEWLRAALDTGTTAGR